MTGINYADVSTLLGGSLYVLSKTYKVKDEVHTMSYYYLKKEEVVADVMNTLNDVYIEAKGTINITYARYDDQGHAQEFLVLYEKDRGCEE